MALVPIRIAVGRTNIRVSDVTSGAAAGRELNAAFKELAGNFGWFIGQLNGYLPEDLYEALEPTFELSQYYVPVDTGELKASGYLEIVPFRSGARVEIGYGKFGSPAHAIFVHEVPRPHAPPTSDKFLEKAIDEDYYNIIQRVTDRIRIRTGSR